MSDRGAPPPHTPPHTLRQYALLADGERGALVGPRGDIAFMCAPRWHDDAVFSDLLGGRGTYVVRPAQDHFVWGGSYERASLVWRSRWVIGSDVVECREALARPTDRDRLVLLRRVEARHGTVPLRIHLDCRSGFGAHAMRLRRAERNVWEGRSGPLHVRWSGTPTRLEHVPGGALEGFLEVSEGDAHDLVLEVSARPLDDPVPDPRRLWQVTTDSWDRIVPPRHGSVAPRDVAHSWAVLHGLTSMDRGMVAAATTSLPERADEGRDYDYRFAWIRDQCFAGQAAIAAGGGDLLESAVGFVRERLLADGPELKPAYTVDGGPVPPQRPLDLPGYPGAPDVRVGNRVTGQFQLDAFGEALLLFAGADRLDVLDGDGWRAADAAVEGIVRRWEEPDAGIWELSPAWWAHSRLICAAGLRAVSLRRPDRAAEWVALADRLVGETNRRCLSPQGRWHRAADDPGVDAALLLPALRGAVPADDPRTTATWRAVFDDLTDDGYVYRFRHGPGPLNSAEGAFLFCGFLLALASHQQGDSCRAIRLFERNRGALGPPGLFTEEFDVVQRQLRGNLPQAFVHALLIETAHTLATDNRGRTHEQQGF